MARATQMVQAAGFSALTALLPGCGRAASPAPTSPSSPSTGEVKPTFAEAGSPAIDAPSGTTQPTGAGYVYAPYVDMTLVPPLDVSAALAAGIRTFSLAFVVAGPQQEPSWGGDPAMDVGTGAAEGAVKSQIAAMRAGGGDVIISFGGQLGQELAEVIADPVALAATYQAVVDEYDVTQVDFDLETATSTAPAIVTRRFQALALLQQHATAQGLNVGVSVTLPATTSGLDTAGVGLLTAARAQGVTLTTVNLMTMDFASDHGPMGQYCTQAAQGLHTQLAATFGSGAGWPMIGLTPMLGQNDTAEVFGLTDARTLAAFAQEMQIGRVSAWSLARDRQDPAGIASVAKPNASGVLQAPFAFSRILSGTGD